MFRVYKRYKNGYNSDIEHHYYFCKNFGFTLAEVLITLGIIGVVAALVMPTIHAKYFEKMVVAKVKQTYSIMGNAVNQMIYEQSCSDNGDCYSEVPAPDIETIASRIDKHFRYTAKVCVTPDDRSTQIS